MSIQSKLEKLCTNCGLCCFFPEEKKEYSFGFIINGHVYNRGLYSDNTWVVKKYPEKLRFNKETGDYYTTSNKNVYAVLDENKFFPCSFLDINVDETSDTIKWMYCLIHGDGCESDPRSDMCINLRPGFLVGRACSILFNPSVKIYVNEEERVLNNSVRRIIKELR